MPNYENGKVYCIRSHATVGCYVGSTTQPLSKRFYEHKQKYNKWIVNNNLRYYTSFKVLEHGIDDCYIELIENVSCNDKKELERREGEIMRITDNCVNKYIIGRTNEEIKLSNKINKKQYHEINKEKHKEHKKIWRENNREKVNQLKRNYNEKNKEKISEYNRKYREMKKAEKAQ